MIDLRSDTVTKPSQEMRLVMAAAEVGDDCFGDDPTVSRLEASCAAMFRKEAALFSCSGTMSNQLAIQALTTPGDEVVLGASYHLNFFESAATGKFSGVNYNIIHTEDGIYDVEDIERVFSTKARWNSNYAMPRVIVVENTIGVAGGTVFPLSNLRNIRDYAASKGACVFIDGARILNASAVSDVPPDVYAENAECISMCFSKGLGAPMGSIIAGSARCIERAKKLRKWMGGDLHQGGVIAAAAKYALENHVPQLKTDHENARFLFEMLSEDGVFPCTYRGTNMVFIDLSGAAISPKEFVDALKQRGVHSLAWDERLVRFVTHRDVTREDTKNAGQHILECLEMLTRGRGKTLARP